ncbi:hypothetical protein GGI43DRAFT_378036 [Trichoderma evansii]
MRFRLRYGVYLPSYASYIRKEATELPHTGTRVSGESKPAPRNVAKEAWRFFMSESWLSVYKRLLAEDVFNTGMELPSDPSSSDVPLVRLVQFLAMQTGQTAPDVARAIGDYLERSSDAHSPLQDYVKRGDSFKLAVFLCLELEDLSNPPRDCEKDVPAIKAAIITFARRYFKEFIWDDERQIVKSWVPKENAFQ